MPQCSIPILRSIFALISRAQEQYGPLDALLSARWCRASVRNKLLFLQTLTRPANSQNFMPTVYAAMQQCFVCCIATYEGRSDKGEQEILRESPDSPRISFGGLFCLSTHVLRTTVTTISTINAAINSSCLRNLATNSRVSSSWATLLPAKAVRNMFV